MYLSKQIQNARKAKGWSQNYLAEISGVPQSAISEIEAGKRKNPGIETLRKISVALGIVINILSEKLEPTGTD